MIVDSIITCFKNYFRISGRARRSEYWCFTILLLIINILSLFFYTSYKARGGSIDLFICCVFGLLTLVCLIPWITVSCRRFHDIGKSASWMFFILVPVIGVIFYIVWMCTPATELENQYGHIYEKHVKRLY